MRIVKGVRLPSGEANPLQPQEGAHNYQTGGWGRSAELGITIGLVRAGEASHLENRQKSANWLINLAHFSPLYLCDR